MTTETSHTFLAAARPTPSDGAAQRGQSHRAVTGKGPPQAIALPGVHEAAQRLLQPLPRGRLIDLACGQGAFSVWARSQGFDVTAVDAGYDDFCAVDIPFLVADLNGRFPFADASVDYVVALEIIEHLENPFHFLRETARVLAPGGQALLSTPNEHNLQSRLAYLLTGYYGDSRHVLRPDDEKLPMRHINMTPPAQLEFVWRSAGLELVNIEPSRTSAGALCLLPLLYPLQRLRYWSRLRRTRDLRDREATRQAYGLLNRASMLTGRVIVYHLRKPD
jgi:SAM-dependent methyltransferase